MPDEIAKHICRYFTLLILSAYCIALGLQPIIYRILCGIYSATPSEQVSGVQK